MSGPAIHRRLALGLAMAAGLALAACGRSDGAAPATPDQITFSILSAEGQAATGPLWQPLLDDMSAAIGVPVQPRFGSSYAELVRAMKDGHVQVGWFSAQPALQAVDTADAEVIARTVNPEGQDSYHSTLIVKKGSGLTLDRVLACDRSLRFGIGDAQSTSGTLAPLTFLFNPRGIVPSQCFRSVQSGNHQANAFAVASGALDVATSNSTTAVTLRRQNAQLADQTEEIWRSPALPESGILLREDLDPALKEKIRSFFLTYGQGDGPQSQRQRQILAGLNYSRFRAADESYLDPVRELVADERLATARAAGDRAGVTAAERELQRLRAKREVQP